MIILENLLGKFRTCNDYEYMGAHHMTHVPSLGSLAYLNIIHKASDPDIQTGIIDPLHLPDEIREFYRSYNGADLFSDTMSIDGFFPHVYRYERTDMRRSYPYNIMDLNDMFANNVQSSKIFLFGSYGHDRSPIFVERSTGRIHCVSGANPKVLRASWRSFEVWITEEIDRLSLCFDEHGNRLVELEKMLPGLH